MKNNFLYCFPIICTLAACIGNQDFIGEQYVGVKYLNNPLGEEKLPDIDPLIRDDAFDCTTFVETSLADGDVEKLNAIRYKNGDVDFVNRNHFVESDWLNNNKNFVENVSYLYGKTAVRSVVIDKKSWLKKKYNIDSNYKKTRINLKYIPYENLSKINIQKPIIVLFIHDGYGFREKIGTDLAVVHMGFLLPTGVLRHASREQGRVVDTDFEQYVARHSKNKHNIGIALVKIK